MLNEREQSQVNVYELVCHLNRSDFRRRSIPQELVSGWPYMSRLGNALCMTLPYYARRVAKEGTWLYPIYCSVTVPVRNPDRILDFTIYPFKQGWEELDYTKPVGQFPHPALGSDIKREGYQRLCEQLYQYYDAMVEAIEHKQAFQEEKDMIELFSRVMEPGQYPQYLRMNRKFYAYFCRLN